MTLYNEGLGKGWRKLAGSATTAGAAALMLAISACNRNEAAQPARAHVDDGRAAARDTGSSGDGGGSSYGARPGYGGGDRYADAGGGRRPSRNEDRSSGDRSAGDREPAPLYHGKPMWSDNRRYSAQENARYQFERRGQDFGAKTMDQYLGKVHAFVDNPPAGVQKLTRRNGDTLMYDPKSNTFAVARRDGAPRTMFKPREGASYWREQQARANDEGSGGGYGGSRSYGGGGGRGGDAG